MNQPFVISVDHGNRLMKTLNYVFPASYVESTYLPPMGGDTLSLNGKTYTHG
ncbi:MAG: hypothetical protein FWB92_02865 [Oscillospiraceae bacterium]|nr:hypothetical protein [Oscillospiraceae bacterium]